MNTPINAFALASVSDTTPTIPAKTATTTENTFGELMRSDTGRMPSANALGSRSKARITSPNSRVATIANRKPKKSARRPRRTTWESAVSTPKATLIMAPYSGPTTMAPTIRICELVRIPTAPMSPAMIMSTNQLAGYTPRAWIRASASSQIGEELALRGS